MIGYVWERKEALREREMVRTEMGKEMGKPGWGRGRAMVRLGEGRLGIEEEMGDGKG